MKPELITLAVRITVRKADLARLSDAIAAAIDAMDFPRNHEFGVEPNTVGEFERFFKNNPTAANE
jgi:hypothetical protein